MSTSKDTDLLAPFEIWEVPLDNRTIKFHQPLVLTPEWLPDDPDDPDENEYLSVKCPELGIDVFAENRDDLQEFVNSDIRFIWKHYVLVDDDRLVPKTRKIKRSHLFLAEMIDG